MIKGSDLGVVLTTNEAKSLTGLLVKLRDNKYNTETFLSDIKPQLEYFIRGLLTTSPWLDK